MSYNISFKVKVDGLDKYVNIGNCDANITWNVRDIITKSTGLEWKNEANNGYCKNIIPSITKGLEELRINGDKYKQYEPDNGWGTVKGTIRFFENIIDAWNELQYYFDDDILNVSTFWIE